VDFLGKYKEVLLSEMSLKSYIAPQSTHLMLLALEHSTGAWVPNAVIVHMIDGSGRIEAPLTLSSLPSVFTNPNSKIIPTAIFPPS
jgi:hypothetical protein